MSEDTPFLPSLPEAALAQQVRTDLYQYLAPFLARLYRCLDLRLVRPAHVSPLTWSHAAYVHAVDGYCRRAAELARAAVMQDAIAVEDGGV